MKRRSLIAVGAAVAGLAFSSTPALADPNAEHASCMGLGSSFYGQFAPQQRAFVAQAVADAAEAQGLPPGAVYSTFAEEKEGGAIPAPCGTRLE
jgi:hypothetical protein